MDLSGHLGVIEKKIYFAPVMERFLQTSSSLVSGVTGRSDHMARYNLCQRSNVLQLEL